MQYHYTGARKSKWDKRNYKWSEIGHASTPFDWKQGFEVPVKLKVKDQKFSSSCGGQAVSYYGEVLNYLFDKSQEERSAKFIYSQCYYPTGGATIDDLAKIVKTKGFGLESLTPSQDKGECTEEFMRRSQDITEDAFKTASKDKALSYVWISNTNIDTLAQAIRDNNGAIIGITGSNNGTWLNKFPSPVNRMSTWNHWMYACGAEKIDGVKYIKVQNSWGEGCGEDGYQWLSEEFFTTGLCFTAVTFIYDTKPVTEFKHTFNYDLLYKMTGQEVKFLQDALKLDGCLDKNVPSSGYYGDLTKQAVSKFQYKYKVASAWTLWWNGGKYVGISTRKKLNELYS